VDAQFAADVAAVGDDGVDGDKVLVGDFFVAQAFGNAAYDVFLAFAQFVGFLGGFNGFNDLVLFQ